MNKAFPAAAAFLLNGAALAAQSPRPNVILFVVDDMGPMDTSLPFLTDSCGRPHRFPLNGWYHTPRMERFAQEGVRFSQFYAQSVSSPSRVSLLTGQNAARHRTTNWIRSEYDNRDDYGPYDWNWQGLRATDYTLPRLLHEAGYRTIHVGKAHLGPVGSEGEFPENLGFDVNIAGSSIGEPGSYLGENGYGAIRGTSSRAVPGLEKYHGSDTFLTEALTLEALAQIDRAADDGVPFFLYLSHYAVHNPFETDRRFEARYLQDSLKSRSAIGYATLVEGMDKSLGDVLDHLRLRGLAENTLVVFLGDNGGDAPLGPARGWASSAPLRGKKGSEFEGGIRVPCIIGWAAPGGGMQLLPVARGTLQTQVACIMDIYPTLMRLVGVSVPEDHPVDGQDLGVLLTGKKDPAREEVFMCHFPHRHRGSYYTTYRNGPWKLIYYYNPAHPELPQSVLFNLEEDPYETTDVSGLHPGIKARLLKEMTARLERERAAYPVDFEGRPIPPRP
ncbi:MAG: sulfatase [Bacteroidales bacterium]|nr:sulfatase [Bacteroidales bacterium]